MTCCSGSTAGGNLREGTNTRKGAKSLTSRLVNDTIIILFTRPLSPRHIKSYPPLAVAPRNI
ncbi:hypothetical protein IF2G_02096 [Cordyceps javanica]|nr:hypothetical protein IF2G_02096 [Cordyceps javanica]